MIDLGDPLFKGYLFPLTPGAASGKVFRFIQDATVKLGVTFLCSSYSNDFL